MPTNSNPFTIQTVPAGSSLLAQRAAAMAVGEWHNFTEGMTGYLATMTEPLGGSTDPASGHILGYINNGCWDSIAKRILFLSSDHFHGTGQARFPTYDDATSTWSRYPEGSWFPRVTASARHGYHHNAIDVAGRKLYHKVFAARQVYRCDLSGPITADSWELLPAPPTNYNASAIGTDFVPWVGSRGSYMTHQTDSGSNGSMYRFDVASHAWTVPANQTIPNSGDIHNIFEAAPSIQRAIMGGGNSDGGADGRNLSVLNESGALSINPTVAPQPYEVTRGLVTHCPVSGDFLFLWGASNWWKYNAVTNTWTQMPGTAHIFDGGVQSGGGSTSGLCVISIDTYGVLMFLKMTGQNSGTIWLYRHA